MPNDADAIRGAALKPFVTWYAGAHGRTGLDRALAGISGEDRRRFDPAARGLGIAAGEWYPAPLVHRMLDGLLDGLDATGRLSLASSGAEQSLGHSLDGYLGAAFRVVASPGVCAFFGPQLWHAFYSGGRVRIAAEGLCCHVMEVQGWRGHHAFLCEMNNAAGRAIYRAAGCGKVTTEHAACIDRGDRSCVYVIRW